MVDVVTTVEIARPRDIVARFSADPSNAPAWYTNIKSVDWHGDPVVAVGAKVDFVAQFMRRTLRYTYEIVEFIPDARLVMRTAEGPFPMETTYTWTDAGAGTAMTLRNRGEPSGFSKLAEPFMSPAMRRANRKDLAKLKAILDPR